MEYVRDEGAQNETKEALADGVARLRVPCLRNIAVPMRGNLNASSLRQVYHAPARRFSKSFSATTANSSHWLQRTRGRKNIARGQMATTVAQQTA